MPPPPSPRTPRSPDLSGPEQVAALVALDLAREEAERAVADDRVPLALVVDRLRRALCHSAEDVEEATGVPATLLRRIDAALGLPTDLGWTDRDMEEAPAFAALVGTVGEEGLLRSLEIEAQSISQLAWANLGFIRDEFLLPLRSDDVSEIALALGLADVTDTLLPVLGPMIGAAFRRVLTTLVSSELVAAATRETDEEIRLCIGFVDVTGYSSLTARIDPSGLDEVLEAFEQRCKAAASNEVRLVKFLGDAGMFAAPNPLVMAATLRELVTDDDPTLEGTPRKGGMAYGPVLSRGGDYFGVPVNLAARLTDRARPGTLLAAEDLQDVLDARFELRPIPQQSLRGMGQMRPLAVRGPRAAEAA